MAKNKTTPTSKDGAETNQTLTTVTSKVAAKKIPKVKTAKSPPKAKDKKNKAKPVEAKALVWETFACQFKPGKKTQDGFRAKVPGGWFVLVSHHKGGGSFFYPDPSHSWKGHTV